jgi:two-component system response regulator AtoC
MLPSSILVVDDDPDTRASLSDVLADLGYAVDVADGGRSALEPASRNGYGLALLDGRMSDMDGVELFVRIRETHADVVGVLVTGFASAETVAAAAEAGVREILPKPVDFRRLLPLVEQAVGPPGKYTSPAGRSAGAVPPRGPAPPHSGRRPAVPWSPAPARR